MIEKLVVDFFNRIEEVEGIDSVNGKAKFLVHNLIEDKYGMFDFCNVKRATRLYKKYVEKDKSVSVTIKETFLKDVMAEYLRYEDYEDFQIKNSSDIVSPPIITPSPPSTGKTKKENETGKGKRKTYNSIRLYSSITVFSISLFGFIYMKYQDEQCIVWKGDHYEKTSCATNGAIDNTEYKINIKAFRKETVDTSTIFFTIMKENERKENYWYGKNREGKGEFFTHRGIHPETKNELEPVSRTILYKEGLLNE